MATFIVDDQNVGKRLDIFLTQHLKEFSRSQIKKKILAKLVIVNGKPTQVHQFLRVKDVIHISEPPLENITSKSRQIVAQMYIPRIIFEDNDFLVLDKPSGMLVHPVEIHDVQNLQNKEQTLSDWLKQKYPEIEKVGEHNYRAGIIHRLDREVSGAMLAAKTQKMYHHLKEQFKKRAIAKEYCALVYGHMPEHEGKIELPIGRNKKGKFVAHPRMEKKKLLKTDRHAITLYRVEKEFARVTLLSIHILTGRTHQIRAHLSALGHPIVGDKKYGPKKPFLRFFSKKIKIINAPRIMLHSKKIGFKNLSQEWKEFAAPMPREMREFLQQLKINPNVS